MAARTGVADAQDLLSNSNRTQPAARRPRQNISSIAYVYLLLVVMYLVKRKLKESWAAAEMNLHLWWWIANSERAKGSQPTHSFSRELRHAFR